MKSKTSVLADSILFIFSLGICFIIGEIGVRFTGITTPPRALLFSDETFQLDSNHAVRYLPNKTIRTIAIYNNQIEFDVEFSTNNLGFIDEIEYTYEDLPSKRYYAFVGDSFTAGYHGGEPWISQLRKKIDTDHIALYNLGVSGVGFEQFYRLIKGVEQQFKITDIIVVAISNDFQRKFWYPLSSSSEIRFCHENLSNDICTLQSPVARVIDRSVSKKEALVEAESFIRTRSNIDNVSDLLRRSELISTIRKNIRKLTKKKEHAGTLNLSLLSLKRIRELYPQAEIHLIHLPQKQEVTSSTYSLTGLEAPLSEHQIHYFPALKYCSWSIEMFFPQDNHPNSMGYKNIANCIAAYLKFEIRPRTDESS